MSNTDIAEVNRIAKNKIDDAFEVLQAKSIVLRSEGHKARKQRLEKLRDWILKHREDIKNALFADFKKPPEEVDLSEVYPVLQEINHCLDHLSKWLRPKKVKTPLSLIGTNSAIHYEPKGICLIIAPWNYPFNLTICPLVSALAAGNTVIIKPSEISSSTSELIVKLVHNCFENDIVRVFTGDKEISTLLLEKPFNHIFFTGSPRVGKIVMGAAAKNLSSVTLELGGKSPCVVDDKADLKDTAEKLVWGKFLNTGQTCVAPDYIICHEQVMSALLAELRVAIDRLFIEDGKTLSQSTAYGRIISQDHFNRLKSMLDQSLEMGARLVYGGETNRAELYIAPTVLTNVPESSTILQEEIFGPLLPVITYAHTEEVISIINSKPKPLAMYLFCGRKEVRREVLARTSAGGVGINETVMHFNHPNLPFGGVNNSGIGKSHGYFGFLAFSNQKGVLKQRVGQTNLKLFYPPYTPRIRKMVDLLIKYL